MHETQNIFSRGRDLAIDLVDGFRVIAERIGSTAGLCLQRHRNFRSIVPHAQHGKLKGVPLDQFGNFQKDFPALRRCGFCPCAFFKTVPRGSGGTVHIDGRGGGDCGQLRPVDGRDDRHYIPVGSRLPATVDEQALRRYGLLAQTVDLVLHGGVSSNCKCR